MNMTKFILRAVDKHFFQTNISASTVLELVKYVNLLNGKKRRTKSATQKKLEAQKSINSI